MNSIMASLFPLIGLIMLGYIFKRKNTFSDEFWAGAEKLNYYVFFPAMLFGNLSQAKLNFEMISKILLILVLAFPIICVVLLILKSIMNIPTRRFGVYVQSNVRFNSYIGLAVVASLFPSEGMTIFALLLAISIPIVNIIAVISLTDYDRMNFKNIVISIFKNPLILGCLVGVAYNLSGLPLWLGVNGLIQQLAYCSLPLGLMCVGAALQLGALKAEMAPLVVNSISRLCIIPIGAWAVCKALGFSHLETQIFVLYFALPTASASYILTKVLGGDSQLMAGVISLQIICAAITLPIVLTIILS